MQSIRHVMLQRNDNKIDKICNVKNTICQKIDRQNNKKITRAHEGLHVECTYEIKSRLKRLKKINKNKIIERRVE